MMEKNKLNRLSDLFEKVVADNASVIERRELSVIYQEYINDGRDNNHKMRTPTNFYRSTA
jgi:hypothetical protein